MTKVEMFNSIKRMNIFLEDPNRIYKDLKIKYRKERVDRGYSTFYEWVSYYYLIYEEK